MNQKNRIISSICSVLLIGTSLVGCGKKDSSKTLNVLVENKGYGVSYIEKAKEIFERENEGYKVNLMEYRDAPEKIESHINKRKNTDDLYIATGRAWRQYANKGQFASLDDLMDEKVDGVKVKDKVSDEYLGKLEYITSKGERHTYRLPWTSAVGGIYFNAKYFGEGKWSIPTTTDELLALCQTIVDEGKAVPTDSSSTVVPFVYTAENTDYFDYAVFSWWAQISGKDAIEDFFTYKEADVFNVNSESHPAYAGLKEATQIWANIFSNSDYYLRKTTTDAAQSSFLNGYAAMMFNCDWIYNEILSFITKSKKTWDNYPDFELQFMPTPKVSGVSSEQAKAGYMVGEDKFIAIPNSSSKKNLAKSFIKVLISDEILNEFANKSNGLMAYNPTTPYTASNSFMKSILDYKNSLTYTFNNHSEARCYLNNSCDVWSEDGNRPFKAFLEQGKSLDKLFGDIYDTAKARWSDWQF